MPALTRGIGETSVTFFGKERAAARAIDFLCLHKKSEQSKARPDLNKTTKKDTYAPQAQLAKR